MWLLVIVVITGVIPVYALIRLFSSFRGKTKRNGSSVQSKVFDSILSIIIYCLLLGGLFLNEIAVDGGEPLMVYEITGEKIDGYAALASEHIISVIVLLSLGIIAFWMLSLSYDTIPPLVYVAASTLVLLNIIFALVYLTHTGFSHDGDLFSVYLLQISFLSLVLLFTARLRDSLNQFLASIQSQKTDYTSKLLLFFYRLSDRYQKVPKLWAVTLFPAAIMIQLILVLFGQRPDSFIRVFLETSSFNYSIIPAPRPKMIPGDGHYLCTVAARGHKKLVKPLRAGIRHNRTITVNRQLLIANAFENILEQYTPAFHKAVRGFYDKYGYPISKHIRTKWSADIVYLIMKPLEWFFLIVLYAMDPKPENRIHIQYSELRKR